MTVIAKALLLALSAPIVGAQRDPELPPVARLDVAQSNWVGARIKSLEADGLLYAYITPPTYPKLNRYEFAMLNLYVYNRLKRKSGLFAIPGERFVPKLRQESLLMLVRETKTVRLSILFVASELDELGADVLTILRDLKTIQTALDHVGKSRY